MTADQEASTGDGTMKLLSNFEFLKFCNNLYGNTFFAGILPILVLIPAAIVAGKFVSINAFWGVFSAALAISAFWTYRIFATLKDLQLVEQLASKGEAVNRAEDSLEKIEELAEKLESSNEDEAKSIGKQIIGIVRSRFPIRISEQEMTKGVANAKLILAAIRPEPTQ